MNNKYLNITEGEITIYCAQNVRHCVEASLELARALAQKERTIFGLLGMLNELGITVLVYSHVSREKVETGKIQRGCLGKLAGLADQIINVKKEEKGLQEDSAADSQSASVASPGGLRVRSTNEHANHSEKLEAIKINELDYARRGSGVSIGGELIMPEVEIESEVIEEELELA